MEYYLNSKSVRKMHRNSVDLQRPPTNRIFVKINEWEKVNTAQKSISEARVNYNSYEASKTFFWT